MDGVGWMVDGGWKMPIKDGDGTLLGDMFQVA
jgi:hypothetical protein